jgi:hypothetical protein
MALLPVISDTVEFTVHLVRGTQCLGTTVLASVIFTAVSTLFELFAMRHGILVVGQNSNSLLQDLKSIPRLIIALFRDCFRLLGAVFASLRRGVIFQRFDL